MSSTEGARDPFAAARSKTLPPIPSKYVSSKTVDVGEGLRVVCSSLERVDHPDKEKKGVQALQVEGIVTESRARRFTDGQDVTITCTSLRLEQMANQLVQLASVHGLELTLVRLDDDGPRVEWSWDYEPAAVADDNPKDWPR